MSKKKKDKANRGPTFVGIFTRKGPTKKERLERARKKHKGALPFFEILN